MIVGRACYIKAGTKEEWRERAEHLADAQEHAHDRVDALGHLPSPPLINGVLPQLGHMDTAQQQHPDLHGRSASRQAHEQGQQAAKGIEHTQQYSENGQRTQGEARSSETAPAQNAAPQHTHTQDPVHGRQKLKGLLGLGRPSAGLAQSGAAEAGESSGIALALDEAAKQDREPPHQYGVQKVHALLAPTGSKATPIQKRVSAAAQERPIHSPLGPPVPGKRPLPSSVLP